MAIYSGFTHWKMVIFHSYVSLPEGNPPEIKKEPNKRTHPSDVAASLVTPLFSQYICIIPYIIRMSTWIKTCHVSYKDHKTWAQNTSYKSFVYLYIYITPFME